FLLGRHFPSDMLDGVYAPEPSNRDYAFEGESSGEPDSNADSRSGFAFYEELSKQSDQAAGLAEETATAELAVPDGVSQGEREERSPQGDMGEAAKTGTAAADGAAAVAAVQKKVSEGLTGTESDSKRIATLYTVQVGAFEEAEGAAKLAKKLATKGYPSYTMVKSIPEKGVWHRVRVGKYESRSEAQHIASLLENREELTTFITLYAE
ncbi:MAG: SPOR domain-containing protein, partial [bacterium]|nr:SPOR domain-containing protein [bacterium]